MRSKRRVRLRLPADAAGDDGVFCGIVTRLTEYGAILACSVTARVGSTVALRLWLSVDLPLTVLAIVRAEVVGTDDVERRGLLLELVGADGASRERIRQYVAAANENEDANEAEHDAAETSR